MRAKILVVDDEKVVADTLRSIFESRGYLTECAYSGQEAIAKAAGSCPDLLLCDVIMADLNGFEVALLKKKMCPDCCILLISGDGATSTLVPRYVDLFKTRGYRFELLSKPSHPSLVLQKVEEALLSGGTAQESAV